MKIDTLTKKDIDNFKKLDINKNLVKTFEENKEALDELKRTEDFKLKFFENDKTIDNIEIGKECIEKGLVLTPLNKCNFIIPTEIVNMIIKYKDNLEGLAHKKPKNFLILYPSKYSKFKNKEIPIEDIGVYYSPYSIFYLSEFSIELLEMKNKPKKASIFKRANALLNIDGIHNRSFIEEMGCMIGILLIFLIVSWILYFFTKDSFGSFVVPILFCYVPILFISICQSLILPLIYKDEIIKINANVNFTHNLNKTYKIIL